MKKINLKVVLICLVVGTLIALATGLFSGFPFQFIKTLNVPTCHTKICPMFMPPRSWGPQLNLLNLVLDGLIWSLISYFIYIFSSAFRKGR